MISWLQVDGLQVEVQRKPVRAARLYVLPPDGAVRVSVPAVMEDRQIAALLRDHMPWVLARQARLAAQPRWSPPQLDDGATLYLAGEPRQLRRVVAPGGARVRDRGACGIELQAPADAAEPLLQAALDRWLRAQLRERAGALVAQWQPRLQVSVAELRVRRMRTRWGTCNIPARRVWLNLELVHRPPESLEYVMVHEMTHLLERGHGARFQALMDASLPDWRERRARLH